MKESRPPKSMSAMGGTGETSRSVRANVWTASEYTRYVPARWTALAQVRDS